ncbi:MAG: YfhO family protein, partial [Prevotella sp.]|nr:YfhO family protein [Prevotella sp.]
VSVVTLSSYEPNELKYETSSGKGGIVVFSEIYYPGWTATIDGNVAKLGRADYVLRALKVPAGKHQIVLTFKPKSIHTTETIAYVAGIILLLALLAVCYVEYKKRKKA